LTETTARRPISSLSQREWLLKLLPLFLFAALALAPIAASFGAQSYIVSLLTRVITFALAAMALDFILGYGGLVSFGHAAFLGIGAYAVGILSSYGFDDLVLQVFAALAASAGFALVTGAISLRTKGVYFIMITLAFGQMLYFLATSLAAFGGDDGMTIAARSRIFGAALIRSDVSLYYFALGCLAATYLALRIIVASRFGRVLRAARENPVRVAAIGLDPFPFQLAAYVISGMATGLAGLLLANQAEFVSPAMMAWQRSGELIFMVVLGGLATLHGAIVGAAAFLLMEEYLSGLTEHWKMIFGPILILIVLFAKGGIVGHIRGGGDG
jgi:branched-chain amino acid transport system permease protein